MAKYNLEKIKSIFEREQNITKTARIYAEEEGLEYSDTLRRRFSDVINGKSKVSSKKAKSNKKETEDKIEDSDFFMPSAWDSDNNKFYSIDEYCEKYNLPIEQVKSSKLVSHQQNHMVYNIAFNPTLHEQTGIDEDFIKNVVKENVTKVDLGSVEPQGDMQWFDRLVYTDVHIGMNPNGSRNIEPLYKGNWTEKDIKERLQVMVSHVKSFKRGNALVIDELGDFLDGLFGKTTRKGHDLPQNMSDKEVFNLGVKFKVALVDSLIDHYDKIICNNVTEDNHSGVFSYFVNKACKDIIEQKYGDRVEYNVIERFIEHYTIGKHTFLISHGKDSESLKFGFKPHIDPKQIEKIDQYCKEYKLYNDCYIEFSKGDSHIGLFDDTSSNDFTYYNYPAFSPPSNWVKSNFKNSKSGFVMFNIQKDRNIKVKIPYYFE